MSEHELEKLLGGFAADTLTPEERQKLFTAALQDQQLFNALADEQALKELLADPAVRRRLLHALNQTSTSGAGGFLSWLDWLRRPATIAYAGGLTAAIFAVLLGTKVYQDSLRQAAQSAATEETKPAQTPMTDAELKEKATVAPAAEPAKKDGGTDKSAKREKAAAPRSQEEHLPNAARDNMQQRSEQDGARRDVEAPVAVLGRSAEEMTMPANKQAATAPSPAAAPEREQMQVRANAPATGAGASAISARTLFYGEPVSRSDVGMRAQEQERAMKPLAESAPRTGRLERKLDQFAAVGKAAGTTVPAKPLGLRYSFVVREADGQDRKVDATAAAKQSEPLRLIVETNQDSYIQIWRATESLPPQLLFPAKDSGQISSKLTAGQRQSIAVSPESGTVTIRLSRVPFGPITKQEAVMLDRFSPSQIQELIPHELATYVVTQDLSPTAQIAVEIPFDR